MTDRVLAIDRFRGITVILMVVGSFFGGYLISGREFHHMPNGFGIADMVAPMFIFAIALTYKLSYNKKVATVGKKKAIMLTVMRYLALIGVGITLTAAKNFMLGKSIGRSDWGVLESIGLAGLLFLICVNFKWYYKFTIGLVVAVGYQFMLLSSKNLFSYISASSHGGILGSILGWFPLMLICGGLVDLFFKNKKWFYISLIPLIAATTVFLCFQNPAYGIPYEQVNFLSILKPSVSLGYVVVYSTLSAVIFALIDIFSKFVKGKKFDFTIWFGQNALLLYLTHFAIGGLLDLLLANHFKTAPLFLAIAITFVAALAYTAVAYYLNKKKIFFRF